MTIIKDTLTKSYISLFFSCTEQKDYELFIPIFNKHIEKAGKDIILEDVLTSMLDSNNFKENILDFFKETRPEIFNEKLLSKLFHNFAGDTNLLQKRYLNNIYNMTLMINNNSSLLSYFPKETLESYLKNNPTNFNMIGVSTFKYLQDNDIFIPFENYCYANNVIVEYLQETKSEILDKDISVFLPEYIRKNIKHLTYNQFFTLHNKNIKEVLDKGLHKEKLILSLFYSFSKSIFSSSKKENMDFLKRYPDWENTLIEGKSLPEILLFNDLSYLKNMYSLEKANRITKNLNNNKYLSKIPDLNEKIKIILEFNKPTINSRDIELLEKYIQKDYDVKKIIDIIEKRIDDTNVFTTNIFEFHSYSNKDFMLEIFPLFTPKIKDQFLRNNLSFNLHFLKKMDILLKIKDYFTPEEKGKYITISLYKDYTSFFKDFKNDFFRENNKEIINKIDEKIELSNSLKKKQNKDLKL